MSLSSQLLHDSRSYQSFANITGLLESMRQQLLNGERKRAQVPQRELIYRDDPFGAFGSMPAYHQGLGLFINKIAAFVAVPSGKSVHAVIAAFSASTGEIIGLLDGAELTALKCSAVSALVMDHCSVSKAEVLGVIGSGEQAFAQARAALSIREIKSIAIYSRNPTNVANFIARLKVDYAGEIRAASSADEAASGCDILVTATTSSVPVLQGHGLSNHTHISCFGAHTKESRELPQHLMRESLLIVEDIPTAVREAGDIHRCALDLEQLLATDPESLRTKRTVFSSTGHAFLDLITTAYVLEAARAGDLHG